MSGEFSLFNKRSMAYYKSLARENSDVVPVDVEGLDVPVGRFVVGRGGRSFVEIDCLPDDRKVRVRAKGGEWLLVRLATGPSYDNCFSFTVLSRP